MASLTQSARPRIVVARTPLDWALEVVAAALLLTTIWTVWHAMSILPDRIPTHFNFQGEVDGYGTKSTLLLLLIPSTVIYAGLTALRSFPRIYNYPVRITPENAPRQYALAVRMMLVLKMEMMALFWAVDTAIVESATRGGGLSPFFLPTALVVLFGTIAWYFLAARRAR